MEAREIERCIDEFGADVYRFCLKLCMNARRRGIAQFANIEEGQEHTVCSGEDIEADYFRREMISEVSRIIQDLPDKFRVPLILFYLFEFKVEQIAEMTGKPPGTVKSRLFKGRKMVKKRLEEAGYGEERF